MKPTFSTLQRHYPTTESREDLFTRIGWSDLIKNSAYSDTCAIRMSVALISAGVLLPGARMKARAGVVKDRYIEPGQGKLSRILSDIWGSPEVYKAEKKARDGIGDRHGVISFFQIHGGLADGGHIDLVSWARDYQTCERSCYFSASEIWFWPLH